MNTLIQHHVKYKEIHGVDEIIMITQSEHKKLHQRLRMDGKCNIPPNKLAQISTKAHYRTDSFKERHQKNRHRFIDIIASDVKLIEDITYNTHTGIPRIDSYFVGKRIRSNTTKKSDAKYHSQIHKQITFHTNVGVNVDMWEILRYNLNTGTIQYNTGFQSNHLKLPVVNL